MQGRINHILSRIYFVFGKLYNQDGVLGGQTNQHDQTNLEVGIVFQSADRNTQIGSQYGHRK